MNYATDTIAHERNQPALNAHLGKTYVMVAELGFDHPLSALIDLRASHINRCAYCVNMHLAPAREARVAQANLDQLVIWREKAVFSSPVRAVLAWTQALTHLFRDGAYDGLHLNLRAQFPDKPIPVISMDFGIKYLLNLPEIEALP